MCLAGLYSFPCQAVTRFSWGHSSNNVSVHSEETFLNGQESCE